MFPSFINVHVLSGPPWPPIGFNVLKNKTSVSLTVSWKPNLDGGYPQHFRLAYKNSTETEYKEIPDAIPDSSDSQSERLIIYTVTGLMPSTDYSLKVRAVNRRPVGNSKSSYVYASDKTTGM